MMVNATDGVQETKEKAESYVIGEGFDFDVFYDTKSEAVNAYYITSFPSTFFIDEEGYLVARAVGAIDLATIERGIEMINGEAK